MKFTFAISIGVIGTLFALFFRKKLTRLAYRIQKARQDRKVHATMPSEMHCPTCWRTYLDLQRIGKLQTIQGYTQCGIHGADLDYGELPPEVVAENRRKIDAIFRNDAHRSSSGGFAEAETDESLAHLQG